MDLLRWILLIVGIVIIVMIYFISRRKSSTETQLQEDDLLEEDLTDFGGVHEPPGLLVDEELSELGKGIRLQEDEGDLAAIPAKAVADKKRSSVAAEKAGSSVPDKIIVIYLVSSTGEKFPGSRVMDAMYKVGLEFGDMNIFHMYSSDDPGSRYTIFSVANLVEPGSFDLASMPTMETPGLTLFISLKVQDDAAKAFDLYMDTANRLKQELSAELRDQARNVLTRQVISHMQDEVAQYCRKLHLARAEK